MTGYTKDDKGLVLSKDMEFFFTSTSEINPTYFSVGNGAVWGHTVA
jgi:hypothetical protein